MGNFWTPILFQAGALLVALAEAVIPSFGVLTIIALSLFGYSWVFILQHLGQTAAWSFLAADIFLVPVAVKLSLMLLKVSPLAHGRHMAEGSGLGSELQPGEELLGRTGVVETQLRPTGKALFEGKLFEVTSEDSVLDKGRKIRITEVTGNKILVEPVSNTNQEKGE